MCVGWLAFRIPTTRSAGFPGPNGILSPGDQFGTALLSSVDPPASHPDALGGIGEIVGR